MKKAALTALLAVVSLSLFSYCPIVTTLSNSTIPCASGLSSDSSQVHAYLWLQGKADWTTNGTGQVSPGSCTAGGTTGGCDSDGVDLMDETCLFDGTSIIGPWDLCASGNPGEYYLFTDWANYVFDGCPSNDSSERAILLIYDDDGKYILQSRSQGKDWDNWDEIGTSAATSYLRWHEGGYWNGDYLCFSVNHSYMNINGAYAPGDAPSSPLITGYRIYFYGGCDYPPTNYSTSAWIAGNAYPTGPDNGNYITLHVDDLPSFTSGALVVSIALIIEGKELPFVSSDYLTITPPAHGNVWGASGCYCHITIETDVLGYESPDCCKYPEWLLDGTTINGWPPDECNVEHCFQWRWNFGNWVSCWTGYDCVTDDGAAKPTTPVITSITDNDPVANTGVTINYTPGTPVLRHDLYRDGGLAQTNFASGSTVTGLDCNGSHSFKIAAISDPECWTIYSDPVSATDGCVGAPGELAQGETSGDALIFSTDETTASWPSYTGATGYKLYRGSQADLVNLHGGAVDNSCLR